MVFLRGVCSVDLSGPHEATPRPGGQIAKDPCHYFLAFTVRPDTSAETHEIAIQTTGPEQEESAQPEVPENAVPDASAMIHAAPGRSVSSPKEVRRA